MHDFARAYVPDAGKSLRSGVDLVRPHRQRAPFAGPVFGVAGGIIEIIDMQEGPLGRIKLGTGRPGYSPESPA